MPPRKKGERILGPYEHGGGWRVIEVAADGSRTRSTFDSEARARRYVELLQQQTASADHTTDSALKEYLIHLKEKGNKVGSIARTTWAINTFFPEPLALWAIKPVHCRALYDATTKPRGDKPALKPDSHRNILAEVKTFLEWCKSRRFIIDNPAEGISGVGRRNKRKTQLRVRDARAWYLKAIELAGEGDVGAIAALSAMLLGMRSTEICSIKAGDIDEDEHPADLVWIPDSKTEAGRRTIEVAEPLRPFLADLAKGKKRDAYIFRSRSKDGKHWRDWPRKNVQRICALAGVPKVSAHGMRGLLATITIERGTAAHLVAAHLGHEDARTTTESYASRGAASAGARRRGLEKVAPKPESVPSQPGDAPNESGDQGI